MIDGVSLTKSENIFVDGTPVIADARALNALSGIDKALVQNLDKFLNTHTIKIDLSEARGKGGKKHYRYIVAAMLTAMGEHITT